MQGGDEGPGDPRWRDCLAFACFRGFVAAERHLYTRFGERAAAEGVGAKGPSEAEKVEERMLEEAAL